MEPGPANSWARARLVRTRPSARAVLAKAGGWARQHGRAIAAIVFCCALLEPLLALNEPTGCSMGSKLDAAEAAVRKLAYEAYPRWQMDHGSRCPASLAVLGTYIGEGATLDPWGTPLIMLCGERAPASAHGLGVLSAGRDGVFGTADDVDSWQHEAPWRAAHQRQVDFEMAVRFGREFPIFQLSGRSRSPLER